MLIYGIKKVPIGSSKPTYPSCIHCKKQGTMKLNFTSNHLHVFWIPVFVYRKKFRAICSYCSKETKKKDFTEPLLREYYQLKSDVKSPLWQYTGLAIILFLAILIFSGK